MEEKLCIKWIISLLVLFLVLKTSSAFDDVVNIPNNFTKIIKENPIVINTVAKHYENPTIEQYQLCTRSRDNCLDNCGFLDRECKKRCPICPILIDQSILVQGINDTLYRLPIATSSPNQTNIIRLTNEIRNIIQTNLGNITANNQNNLNIYQNKTSRSGGRFGLGYTERGQCCHLLEPQKCRRTSGNQVCVHRHQRTCGSHCISRVMRAKHVVTCSETNPDDCTQTIEYLPQLRRPGCQYINTWPFIKCSRSTMSRRRKTGCTECFKIPYLNVMRGQVPRNCLACFGRVGVPSIGSQNYPLIYNQGFEQYPMIRPYQTYYPQPVIMPSRSVYDINSHENDSPDFGSNEVTGDEEECINEDGTISADCQNNSTVNLTSPSEDAEPELDSEIDADNEDYDEEGGEEENSSSIVRRHRRKIVN